MSNVYHILCRHPALLREEMYVEQEELAKRLVESGLLRIDAHNKCNFSRLYRPYERINLTFTKRELSDPKLLVNTKKTIKHSLGRHFYGHSLDNKVANEIARLNKDILKFDQVDLELEMKIARLLIQANHPVVFYLILIEQVEVYVSYSFNIGDVLDVITYQHAGKNGGMQSTDGTKAAIFVSCGGDPFNEPEQKDLEYGDGFPAMARLIVIAGQELGHYADIIRDGRGYHISRHSSNIMATKPKAKMRKARLDDIENVRNLEFRLNNLGLTRLNALEAHVKVNRKYKKFFLSAIYFEIYRLYFEIKFRIKCYFKKLRFYKSLPKDRYLAHNIALFIADQKFNLSPQADAYRNEDPIIEETIACVEAIARVPQQVNKWGHLAVKTFYPNLYRNYYGDIINSDISSVEIYTGAKLSFALTKPKTSLWYKLKTIFKKKNRPLLHLVRTRA